MPASPLRRIALARGQRQTEFCGADDSATIVCAKRGNHIEAAIEPVTINFPGPLVREAGTFGRAVEGTVGLGGRFLFGATIVALAGRH